MQADRLVQLMNNPDDLDNRSLEELSDLIEEFPYFQSAHLLLTLNLKECNDSRYYAQLRKTACYMEDRRMLFYRIEKEFYPFLQKSSADENTKVEDTSFDLIDFFLSQETKKPEHLNQNLSGDLLQADYLTYSLNSQDQEMQLKNVKPLKHQEAIDKFLSEDEKSPIQINFKDTDTAEELFLNMDEIEEESFFSETLAKIYLKQKKYEKALEIIRKLDLIYPEKNRYFADQIRFLEKLIINAKK